MTGLDYTTVTDQDIERLHHEQWEFDRRYRFIASPGKRDKMFAHQVEEEIKRRLIDRGYVVRSTGNSDPFDLWCNGARIEVKAAMCSTQGYRANMRSNEADVLILACQNIRLHFFVIPFPIVRGKCYVKIPSHNPQEYIGMYSRFYEAWDVVDEAVARAPERYQLALFQE